MRREGEGAIEHESCTDMYKGVSVRDGEQHSKESTEYCTVPAWRQLGKAMPSEGGRQGKGGKEARRDRGVKCLRVGSFRVVLHGVE